MTGIKIQYCINSVISEWCAMDIIYANINTLYYSNLYDRCDEHRSSAAPRYFGRNGFRDTWFVPVPAGTSQGESPLPPGPGPGRSSSRPSTDLAYRCASEISVSDLELLTVAPVNRDDCDGPRSTILRMFTGFRGTGARGGIPVTCEYNDSVSASRPPALTIVSERA
jgi:hypothetical protein